ncbi:IS1182 family transposase [Abyssisolibacter fermentans]|uniref:IS1182 family transposase n=1 Tax=Abyssisolibacter fermentans TaxID=1766203 RepID=UPI00082D96DA|nr:IS1182 family transposase [Abyssisolibacter fermentans]
MQRFIEGKNRNQINIVPMSFEDKISKDNPVRIIDALVESFDMHKLGFVHAKTKKTGRKPYNPKDLMKLYIYGYFNGIRSSRKLEKECKRNIEVMWLLNELTPDDKTICNFRKNNKKALMQVFKQFSMLCNELNLYGKEIIAIDGSKFRANNSRRKNYTRKKVAKMMKHYEEIAQKYIDLLEENDETEIKNGIENNSKEEIKEKLEKAKKRIAELTEMADEISKNGDISITDPDAKHMGVSNNGTDIAHNVQIAVDSKNDLVVTVDVISSAVDKNQLHNMASKAIKELGIESNKKEENKPIVTVLADKGYYTGEELLKCKKDKIKAIVAQPRNGSCTANEEYLKEKFEYDKNKDVYICPNNQVLRNISRPTSKQKIYKNPKACEKCNDKDKCTTAKKGRKVLRGEYQDIYDEAAKTMDENKKLYKRRQMIVEHPFGTIKRALGFTYFLTRGNESVKAESYMHFFIYNLKRVINIIKIDKLLKLLKAKRATFFAYCKYVNFFAYFTYQTS